MTEPAETLRLDKWLWFARFFKTRTLAAGIVRAGKVRVDGLRVTKPAFGVSVGAVLTFAQQDRIRVVRIEALGIRRGPAPEAQTLYEDLSPIEDPPAKASTSPREGRPSKQDRRRIAAFKEGLREP